MPIHPLAELMEALGTLVLERHPPDGMFRLLSPCPEWFRSLAPAPSQALSREHIGERFPVLQTFLDEAEHQWTHAGQGLLRSGFWTEQDAHGAETYFEATAVSLPARQLLLIHQTPHGRPDTFSILQQARARQLQHHYDMASQKKVEGVLSGMLEQSEHVRDDLIAILNQLRLGTIVIDQDGVVTFISDAAQHLLRTSDSDILGRPWHRIPAFTGQDISAVTAMLGQAVADRTRIPLCLFPHKKHRVWLEVDIQDDPRNPQRNILYLYDTTEVHDLRTLLTDRVQFHDLVGGSHEMQTVFQHIQDIAQVEAPVLIEGETGTGKELVARAIHEASPRRDQPFIPINCAGLTDSLLGSQLFGHKRGAFTGAHADHQGFFEAAHGGTLFLDEIGDMPMTIQTTLLRALQEKEITRVGESHPRKIDVRVVAATHQHLQDQITEGKFRADLFYRIRVARLSIPPLRARREDIPLLCSAFLSQITTSTGKRSVEEIGKDAMQLFLKYPWPGNVRELRSAIEYAVIHCRGPVILASDLPPEIHETPGAATLPFRKVEDEEGQIRAALQAAGGNRVAAAKLLGMSRSTFYRRLTTLDIATGE